VAFQDLTLVPHFIGADKKMSFISGYKNFSVTRAGSMTFAGPKVGISFEVDQDLSLLFPYINSSRSEAKFFVKPRNIRFYFQDASCTLFSSEVIAAPFHDEGQAHDFVDQLLRYLNDLYERRDSIKPDYTVVAHLSPMDIYQLLPKTNCKKCGYESCLAFAAAVSKEQASPAECPEFEEPIAQKSVYPIFDKQGNFTATVELRSTAPPKQATLLDNLLTEREVDVLRLLAKGFSNPEMARLLAISQHTVKTHVTHVYDKLGVNDRAQAAVWATLHDLI
jgi:DNA-binding CsgD family transcriptional regulator/ArsR family metal-binding transcriptional regulator